LSLCDALPLAADAVVMMPGAVAMMPLRLSRIDGSKQNSNTKNREQRTLKSHFSHFSCRTDRLSTVGP
jgi:hypothetical protein